MFADGSKVYAKYKKQYKQHKKGYVILGPPGSGKTTFVRNQKQKHWIDADDLFQELGVKWHQNERNLVDLRLNYLRADYMLEQSRALGFRIVGALFWQFVPDAIVMPNLRTHKKYLHHRKDLKLPFVLEVRKILKNMAKKHKVPIFASIKEAVDFLK